VKGPKGIAPKSQIDEDLRVKPLALSLRRKEVAG